ncbi:hypothetical protein BKI52_11915 [marine bacterium AO1-C]|nr:hypothetical protein BKI52_11915 [marine bacterium AO1-C]
MTTHHQHFSLKQITSKYLFFILCIIGFLPHTQAQGLQWAKGVGGSLGDFERGMAVDAQGNIYIIAEYQGNDADFDPNTGTAILNNQGSHDIVLAKYNQSGELLWAHRIGGDQEDLVNAIDLDNNGNVYITGIFYSANVDFDPGAGIANLSASSSGNAYIAKYATDGTYQWAYKLGGSDYSRGFGLTVNGSDLYIVGGFKGSNADFDPGTGTTHLSSASTTQADIFIAKYTTDAVIQWAHSIGNGDNTDIAEHIGVDGSGNVYVAGYFRSANVDFDPGLGTDIVTNSGETDIFITKYNSSGHYQWVKTIGADDFELVQSLAVDNDGNCYVTGQYYSNLIDFDPGSGVKNLTNNKNSSNSTSNIFIAKYDQNGAMAWAHGITYTSQANKGIGLALDAANNVYATGKYSSLGNDMDFDPGPGIFNLQSNGFSLYLIKLDTDGNFQWAFDVNGVNAGDQATGQNLVIDARNNIYISGNITNNSGDFDLGAGTTTLTSSGDTDIFFAKYCQVAPEDATTITGAATVCAGQNGVTYSLPAVNDATEYVWSLPTGVSIASGGGTHNIIVNFSNTATSGNIAVTPKNNCGDGAASVNFAVTVNPLPADAGAIAGPTIACTNQTGLVFKVPAISQATSYIWTVPTGASIVAGGNTNQITVDFGSTSGSITVKGSNTCGEGVSSSFSVTVGNTFTPTLSLGASVTSIGKGIPVTFTATTSQVNNETFQWTINGQVLVGVSGAIYVTDSLKNGDEVQVNMSTTMPCATVQTLTSEKIPITITEVPQYNWAQVIQGGGRQDQALDVTTDQQGNVYLTGYVSSTALDFDPAAGNTTYTHHGSRDIFVAKYDKNGVYQWVQVIGGTSNDVANAIAVDDHGNVFITGYFESSSINFDPSGVATSLNSKGFRDLFLAKYNSNGEYQWAWNIGGGFEEAKHVTTDNEGNVIITGSFFDFMNNIDFDPATATSTKLTYKGGFDGFVAKYNTNGTLQWAHSIGGSDNDWGYGVATNQENKVYLTGSYKGTVNFGATSLTSAGNEDIFVLKYDKNGIQQWVQGIGGTEIDLGTDLVVDANGQVIVAGTFKGTAVDFDPGAGSLLLNSAGAEDGFLLQLNTNGELQWAKSLGGTGQESNLRIAVDVLNNVVVTGTTQSGTLDFDPGTGDTKSTISGTQDLFLVKYNVSGEYKWGYLLGASGEEPESNIAIDQYAIYLSGSTTSQGVDFDLGVGVASKSAASSQKDILVAKYCQTPISAGNISGNNAVCATQGVQTYSIAAIEGATSYQWTLPTGTIIVSGEHTSAITIDLSNASSGNITVKGVNTCGVGEAASLFVNVSQVLTPSATITASANNVCTNMVVTFTSTLTNVGASPTYQWQINGIDIAGANADTYQTSSLQNGDKVTLKITTSLSCVATSNTTSNEILMLINVPQTPVITITSNAPNDSIASGQSITFSASTVNVGSNPTYQWQVNGQNMLDATAATFTSDTLSNQDTITVIVTTTETCVDTNQAISNKIILKVNSGTTTALPTKPTQATLLVYPNPSTERLKLQFAGKVPQSIQLEVYDISGKLVTRSTGAITNGTFELYVRPLAEGNYLLKIYVGDDVLLRRFAKR